MAGLPFHAKVLSIEEERATDEYANKRPSRHLHQLVGRRVMNPFLRFGVGRRCRSPPWNDKTPVREELFGVDRLEQHAGSLAAAQPVTTTPPRVLSLQTRLKDNAKALLAAYRASALQLESGRGVVPAAEWLLDNYHLIEAQIDSR